MDMEVLVRKAMPSSMFDDSDRRELQTWADGLRKNSSFAQSNYALCDNNTKIQYHLLMPHQTSVPVHLVF